MINSAHLSEIKPGTIIWPVFCIDGKRPKVLPAFEITSNPYPAKYIPGSLFVSTRNAKNDYETDHSLRDAHVKGLKEGPQKIYNMHRWFLSHNDAVDYVHRIEQRKLPPEYLALIDECRVEDIW